MLRVLFVFSILYIQGLGSLAPVYTIGMPLMVAIIVDRILTTRKLLILPKSLMFYLFLCIYSIANDLYFEGSVNPTSGNLVLGVLGGYAGMSLAATPYPGQKNESSFTISVLVVLALDRLIQFSPYALPFYDEEELFERNSWIYAYKSSYLAGDSNSVGLFLLVIFGFLSLNGKNSLKWKTLEGVLQIATFSRASILAAVIREFWILNIGEVKKIFLIFVAIAGVSVYALLSIDDKLLMSPLIKFQTLMDLVSANFNFMELLFGHGNGGAKKYLGIYLHAWPLTALYELGLVGLMLMVLYIYFSARESTKFFSVVLVPVFFVAGLSFMFYLTSAWLTIYQYVYYVQEKRDA